jgi:hypothetical protein
MINLTQYRHQRQKMQKRHALPRNDWNVRNHELLVKYGKKVKVISFPQIISFPLYLCTYCSACFSQQTHVRILSTSTPARLANNAPVRLYSQAIQRMYCVHNIQPAHTRNQLHCHVEYERTHAYGQITDHVQHAEQTTLVHWTQFFFTSSRWAVLY